MSASFGPSSVRANTEQSTRAVARPTSLWHQPETEQPSARLPIHPVPLLEVHSEVCEGLP